MDEAQKQVTPRTAALSCLGCGGWAIVMVGLLPLAIFEFLPLPPTHIMGIVSACYGLIIVGLTGVEILISARSFLSLAMSDTYTRRDALSTAASVAVFLVAYPYVFGALCESLYFQSGGFAGVPLAGHRLPVNAIVNGSWIAFAYSWFLDSVTFNASQLGGWLTTTIHPTAWWSYVLVWLFSVITDIIIFAGILNVVRQAWAVVTRRQGAT